MNMRQHLGLPMAFAPDNQILCVLCGPLRPAARNFPLQSAPTHWCPQSPRAGRGCFSDRRKLACVPDPKRQPSRSRNLNESANTLRPEHNFITEEPYYQPIGDEIAVFEETNATLQEKLAAIDPENCTMYGGGANTIR